MTNKNANSPSERGSRFPAKPLAQLTKLLDDSERRGQSTSGPSLPAWGPGSPSPSPAVQLGSCRRVGHGQPIPAHPREPLIQHIKGLSPSTACWDAPRPKAEPRKDIPISELLWCLLPCSSFYISFPHIMAIYILQQSTLVSKIQTRNNNTSPGSSQKPQLGGGFGNQFAKTSGSLIPSGSILSSTWQ